MLCHGVYARVARCVAAVVTTTMRCQNHPIPRIRCSDLPGAANRLLSAKRIIPRHRPSVLPGCCTIAAESSCNDVPAVRSRETVRFEPRNDRHRRLEEDEEKDSASEIQQKADGSEMARSKERPNLLRTLISRTSSPRQTGRSKRSFSESSRFEAAWRSIQENQDYAK
ncbi:unnamed protein product [Lasius platythorax]|uniref:Uncharacterized protein n=1 Tax=Lasius platythorax TaxID=488582 RepID=A0AAV2NJK6_9HYME